jgi:hypothetical protein
MRVCFKSTEFLDDEIMLSGFAFGCLSEIPPDLYHTACMAQPISNHLGIFGFKPVVLLDILAGEGP